MDLDIYGMFTRAWTGLKEFLGNVQTETNVAKAVQTPSITLAQLQSIMPNAGSRAQVFYKPLIEAMARYNIDTKLEYAAFLATVAEESGELRWVKEIWGPTAAQKKYEGRKDLGNTQAGDGKKFCGRGLIQVTGRSNYTSVGKALKLDLVNKPELLEQPKHAADSAAYFWWAHELDDEAARRDFRRVTKVVNGGYTNWERREAYYERACKVLGA